MQQAIIAEFGAETDTYFWERELSKRGWRAVAGVDEAGRGPLAGPVVAACVLLPHVCAFERFKDSKILDATTREALYLELHSIGAMIGIGIASTEEIESLNILHASLLAMRRAVEAMESLPDFLLIDGKFTAPIAIAQRPLVKGERRSASIAAASIVAKVQRDAIMAAYDAQYPAYNFSRHKGYPTAEHRRKLLEHGPCPIHRKTFKGVRECPVQAVKTPMNFLLVEREFKIGPAG